MKRGHVRVALVTGATSGFGKEIASSLCKEGFKVYGTGRSTAQSVREDGVRMLTMDVTDPESVRTAVKTVIYESGQIDLLVNNAGMGIAGAVELASEDEMRLQIETNFFGMCRVCSSVLPYMRERHTGHIVNISSIAGIFAVPYQGFYSASKSAIEAYSEALELETRKFGIRVSIIEPGDFRTGFTASRRVSAATAENSDYGPEFKHVLTGIEKDEQGGADPAMLAKAVCRLVKSRNPRFRVLTGGFVQTSFARISPLLPHSLKRYLLTLFYGMHR